MGATRKEPNDAIYEATHAAYLIQRERILKKAKETYQKNKVAICAAMKAVREEAREARLLEKRRALYAGKHMPPTEAERYGVARDYIANYKAGKPCMDCHQEFAPCAMDFDHVIGEKKKDVSSLTSLKSIKEEIAKCDLVCACCHRVRTLARSK
jgi:hypothetical protein